MLSHLAQIITLAANHGLQVQLTLFDWWSSYTDIAGSQQWASAVLSPYAHDPRIAFVELQNEMDPTNAAAMSWARQMLPFIRSLVPGTPLTISVWDGVGVPRLSALLSALQPASLDFADLHYYGGADVAETVLQQAMNAAAPLPLFIGETGYSSSLGNTQGSDLPNTTQSLEAYQDYYTRSVEFAAQSLGLPVAAVWTLTDFAPGSLTWVSSATSPEYGFGLYRTDGSAKPAAASVSAVMAGGAVDTTIDNGFESCTAGSTPPQWLIYHGSEGQFACDMTVSHSGTASARISQSTGDSAGEPAFYETPIVGTLVPGKTYTATVWARGLNATGATGVVIAWFSATTGWLSNTSSAALPAGTTNWTQLTASGVAPAGATYVQIHLRSSYNTGTAWFDDVSFS
jgi:hypothetical protein